MAIITILVDPHRLLPSSGQALTVETVGDYARTCVAIRDRLRADGAPGAGTRAGEALSEESGPLDVHVRDAAAATWLSRFARMYGESRLRVRDYTARQALQEQWGVSVPAGIMDREILQSGLLNEPVTARPQQSFEDALLEHFYGPELVYARFPGEHLTSLLNRVDGAQWEANARRPLVAQTFRHRMRQWVNREQHSARRTLIELLEQEPVSLRTDLANYWLLHRYPHEVADRALGERAGLFRQAALGAEGLHLPGLDLSRAVTEVEFFLEARREHVQSGEDLSELLGLISGELLVEFDTVEGILQQRPTLLSADLLGQVEQRFAPLRDRVGTRLAALRRLIAPPRPESPDASWGAEDWLAWARDSYMPYYRWLEARGGTDEEVAGYASAFADWYYERYVELKGSAERHFAFARLYLERDRILDGDQVSLVVLVDNFNYVYFEDLRRLFNRRNFSLAEDKPAFSLAPTETAIGKPPLIWGSGDQSERTTDDYATLLSRAWGARLKARGKSALYLQNLGELQALKEQQHELLVLNYLPIDHVLHQSKHDLGQEHADLVLGALERLVDSIGEYARRFGLERRLAVYVTSDHGSTRIARETVNVLDKQFFKNLAVDKHHRFIQVEEGQFRSRPQMVDAQCYALERERFRNEQHYLVARGYYRFAETEDTYYVHGGLTPEEVVVPFARFEMRTIRVLPPILRLDGEQFRYAVKSTVRVEVSNPNSYPLEMVTVRLKGFDSEEQTIPTLGPRQRASAQFQVTFRRVPGEGNTRDLMAEVRYECQGRPFAPESTSFAITIKALMEVRDEFDF